MGSCREAHHYVKEALADMALSSIRGARNVFLAIEREACVYMQTDLQTVLVLFSVDNAASPQWNKEYSPGPH